MTFWASTFNNPEGKRDALKNLAKANSLCVSKESDGKRLFALFDSLKDFLDEYNNTKEKTFFECIRDKNQKIYFDIDVNINKHPEIQDFLETGKNIVYQIVKASIKAAEEFGVVLVPNDFAIFTSSNDKKVSYHIITHKHKVLNNKLNRVFFEKVITFVENRYHQFIDSKMYSSFQQFRMVGCTKEGAERYKLLVQEFQHKDLCVKHIMPKAAYKNIKYKQYYIFEMSLISRNEDCKVIPIPLNEDNNSNLKSLFESVVLTEEDITYIDLILKPAFERRSVEGNLISYLRIKSSKCIVCERYHDSDNPYVTVIDGNIRVHCHRAKNEHKDMGYLPSAIKALMPSKNKTPSKSSSLPQSIARSEFSTSDCEFMRSFTNDGF